MMKWVNTNILRAVDFGLQKKQKNNNWLRGKRSKTNTGYDQIGPLKIYVIQVEYVRPTKETHKLFVLVLKSWSARQVNKTRQNPPEWWYVHIRRGKMYPFCFHNSKTTKHHLRKKYTIKRMKLHHIVS